MNLRRLAAVLPEMDAPGIVGNGRARTLVFLATGLFAALLFAACGSGSSPSPPAATSAPTTGTPSTGTSTSAPAPALPDVNPTAADFVNINTMTRVGDHFIGSLNGHLAAALAVARNPKGGVYPVGTVIQLIPTEAMVKRHAGYSPATGDWEFFALEVSARGTQIGQAGARVKNFFGGDCSSCHRAAERQFDFVCEKHHGCPPLPLTPALLAAIQQGDPRPRT